MIVEFQDTEVTFYHDKFQLWRSQNNDSFFVNVKSPNNLMLHSVVFQHHGDFEWERQTGWGSLTRSRKICSDNAEELIKLVAERYDSSKLKICADCKPV